MSATEPSQRERELELALDELRGRLRFLVELEHALQALESPREIMQSAARLLSEHLDVDRCAYANVEEEKVFDITGDWARGVPSIVGRWDVAAFGSACAAHMLAGTAYIVDDAEADPRLTQADLMAYRATTIRAVICVPLHKQGVFTAAMAVHQKAARHWTPEEVELVTTVVARCWETLERAAVTQARNATQLALAESASRLEYAVRLSGVGFWYCDLPFDELLWDERVKTHFWLPADTRVTIDVFYERIHPDDRDRTRAAIDASIANHGNYDIIYRTVDAHSGSIKHIRALGGTAYAIDGTPLRFDGVTLDVTELRENDRRKDEFLAMLAHELRNPLAPIRTGLELIEQANPAVLARTVAMMKRQVTHLVRIVDDLLDISRINFGKVALVRTDTDARAVIESALEVSRSSIDDAGHRVTVAIDDQPLPLFVDATRIMQVLANLLGNAAKHTPRGGNIEVSAERIGERVRVRVTDDGFGIAADQLGHIFEMFAQLETSESHSQVGLGIGLTLARRLVEMHGGTIAASSEGMGKGSTFTVELPLATSAGLAPTLLAPVGVQPRRGLRVLVVDDNVDAAELLGMALEADGHDIRRADTGREALRVASEFIPEVVLLDLGLPDIEGYEVGRQLRANAELGRPLLVALTGWGDEIHRRKTTDAGFDEHLVKPVDGNRIRTLLANVQRPIRGT